MKKILLSLFCGFLLTWQFTNAQVPGNPKLKSSPATPLSIDKSPTKLSPELKKMAEQSGGPQVQSLSIQKKPVPVSDALDKYMLYQGGGVVVDVSVKGDISTAKSELQKNGFRVTGVYGRVISGIVPLSALGKMEGLSSIQYVKPAFKPVRPFKSSEGKNAGKKGGSKATPVISQGDTAERSDIARKKYGVNGKGVKVGVLSDSYDILGTADIGVKHGELPGPANPFHFNKKVEVLEDLGTSAEQTKAVPCWKLYMMWHRVHHWLFILLFWEKLISHREFRIWRIGAARSLLTTRFILMNRFSRMVLLHSPWIYPRKKELLIFLRQVTRV